MEIMIIAESIALVAVFVLITLENKRLFDELIETYRDLRSERRSNKILRDYIRELKESADE